MFDVKIIESVHAMAEPQAQPHTDDMREMIDHFRRLGLIQRRPSAFQILGTLFVHPALMTEMRSRLARSTRRMEYEAFFGARGV